ncbi:MAG: S8 family serine peptidase [bacterium]|nr:S8 family serine peptidase [bacterium]
MTKPLHGKRAIGSLVAVLTVVGCAMDARGDQGSADPSEPSGFTVATEGARTQLSLDGSTVFHATDQVVKGARWLRVPDTQMQVVLWQEVSADGGEEPYYAISLDGRRVDRVRNTSYELKLVHGDFDPLTQRAQVGSGLRAAEPDDLYVVQFVTQPLEAYRAEIRRLGGRIHHYVANHAHIVRMDSGVRDQVSALAYVRWIGPYHPAYRLERFLADNHAGLAEAHPSGRYIIELFAEDAASKLGVAERIVALGGTIDVVDAGLRLLQATLTPAQLTEVVGMDDVFFVDRWGPPVAAMNNVRTIGGADYLESVAGYTGEGVRGEVMDNGCQTDHPAYASRLTVRRGPADYESHGTSTFGIVFGDGTGSSSGRGMMPDGFGIFSMWGPPNRYTDAAALVADPYYCVFQSNSWGTSPFARDYTTASRELDRIVFDYDIVILQGQGNYSNQDSLREAWGKNIVSIGGINHYNTLSTADDGWNGDASIGPASDGRIKPDLCYWYDSIRTTTTGSGYTSYFGGTSAATPETAGHFGLFFQMWAEGIFGNPISSGTVFEERAHASTAKAVMINTAQAYSFSGTGHDLTRTHQGWGLSNVQNAYDMRERMLIINETDLLANLQHSTYSVAVLAGEPALRATLVYTDPEGTSSSSVHRVNDLSLRVSSPGGVHYWGNNGLLEGDWSTSGGQANTIDTVENVFVQNPQAGTWTIEVFADEINEDGHEETPELDVDYALVVSGVVHDCNANAVDDALDISGGTSYDCNTNGLPDECDGDCNSNGLADECDIAAATSSDCSANGIPDECEPDCNTNGVADDCDIIAGTSTDCWGNGVPDECDPDCNLNGVPDICDVLGSTSADCQPNSIPDDCELADNDCNANLVPDECEFDCNTNGVADQCDITQSTSDDCNTNGRPDECDVQNCIDIWDGFQPNPPFSRTTPIAEIDYDGDGVYWDNPEGTAVVDTRGCQTGASADLAVAVSVDEGLVSSEDGYVASEFFRPYASGFAPDEPVYSLRFSAKVGLGIDSKWDWQFFIYDGVRESPVVRIDFVSTESTRPGVIPGNIVVRNPAWPPESEYLDTGVFVGLDSCYEFEVVMDTIDDTLKVYIDGDLKVTTTSLTPNGRRMDYLRIHPVSNMGSSASLTQFKLDDVHLCLSGGGVAPENIPDCNTNSVFDECDIAEGTSTDCNENQIPDECESLGYGDFDTDEDVDLIDFNVFEGCLTGPGVTFDSGCDMGDFDCDNDVDLADFRRFQTAFTG